MYTLKTDQNTVVAYPVLKHCYIDNLTVSKREYFTLAPNSTINILKTFL